MTELKKHIYNESNGLRYELIGDYYIRCEMTPTSIGGGPQVCISGSPISHPIYAPRGCAGIRIGICQQSWPEFRSKTRERVLNPLLTLTAEEQRPIGKWGRMHRDYIKEHNPILYGSLVLEGILWPYLAGLNEQVQSCLECIIDQMKVAEGLTGEMKAHNQMAWVQAMNNIYNRAEEIVLSELVYGEVTA